ncbi:MAG: GNAT family N-acetyltransferase [Anaerolineae bacterium]
MDFLSSAERPSPLANQIACKTRDLDWTLAHFTFVANVTTLAAVCDIAHSPAMSVASCRSLPQLGLAFVGDSADLLATYAAFLADPGSEVSLLVNEEQRAVVEAAFEVASVVSCWQMLYRGDPGDLPSSEASELVENDADAAYALARTEGLSLNLVSAEPFAHGPAYGVWERGSGLHTRRLIAMGTTTVCVSNVAQIDNVITRREFRRRGYGTAIVVALLRAHLASGRSVFAVVSQDNGGGVALFEKLGFSRERPMYSMSCVLRLPLERAATPQAVA